MINRESLFDLNVRNINRDISVTLWDSIWDDLNSSLWDSLWDSVEKSLKYASKRGLK